MENDTKSNNLMKNRQKNSINFTRFDQEYLLKKLY